MAISGERFVAVARQPEGREGQEWHGNALRGRRSLSRLPSFAAIADNAATGAYSVSGPVTTSALRVCHLRSLKELETT